MAVANLADAKSWAMTVWPHFDWSRAAARHGAFHEVLVLPHGPVARITCGQGHQERTARESRAMSAVAALQLPIAVPAAVSDPVTCGDRTGVLTSLVPGCHRSGVAWRHVRSALVAILGAVHRSSNLGDSLPPPRAWCGGAEWSSIVRATLVPRLPTEARAQAHSVVQAVLVAEQDAVPTLVHGDFGLHNVLWLGSRASGLIDPDHACWGDPAIDIAPLVGHFGVQQLADDVGAVLLQRAMHHRASLPLQVAAAAELVGDAALRDHALTNFVRRSSAGTLHDPGGHQPGNGTGPSRLADPAT